MAYNVTNSFKNQKFFTALATRDRWKSWPNLRFKRQYGQQSILEDIFPSRYPRPFALLSSLTACTVRIVSSPFHAKHVPWNTIRVTEVINLKRRWYFIDIFPSLQVLLWLRRTTPRGANTKKTVIFRVDIEIVIRNSFNCLSKHAYLTYAYLNWTKEV